MKGLILSGGKGTRLYPITFNRAKQLVPVANKPVLFRVIEAIQEAGIDEIGIVIGDTGDEIRQAVGQGRRWGVNVTYIPQEAPLGLAHAVKISQRIPGRRSLCHVPGRQRDPGRRSASLIRQFAESDWNSQVVLTEVEQPQHYGVAELDDQGRILRLVEKPRNPPSNLALVGIYMFDHQHLQGGQRDQAQLARRAGDHRCHPVAGGEWLSGAPVYPSRLVDRHRQAHRHAGSQQPRAGRARPSRRRLHRS